jgi:hypothetical protein
MSASNKDKYQLGSYNKRYNFITLLLCIALVLFCIISIHNHGMDILKWDLLLISGVATFIPAVRLAFGIPAKLDQMLSRLVHRSTLEITEESLIGLKRKIQRIADIWAKRTGIFVAVTILIAFLNTLRLYSLNSKTGLTWTSVRYFMLLTGLEVVGGFIAGIFLGGMAGYGRLGWLLKQQDLTLKIQPGDIDGVAGLKPIGEFYFWQAMIAAIPALFLAVWLLIIQFGNTRYEYWRLSYAGLLAIVLVFELLVFWMPLVSFHREMLMQKRLYLKRADELSREMTLLQLQLTMEKDVVNRELLKDKLSSMTKEYWDIEKLPTWPVAVQTKRLFKRNNFALILPLVIELINRTRLGQLMWWKSAMDVVEKVMK